jgi:glycosyltransferase involved in cell wall biosynthesis
MLSAGGLTVHRGMGRYTRQQLREVLRIDSANEYVLFCRQDADLPALLPDIAGAPNVSIAWLPPLPSQDARSWQDLNRPTEVLRATDELQRAIDAQGVDVFHLTTPGHLDELVPFSLDGPLVATHYDLIPLLFPVWYLREPGRRELYERALRLVRRASRVVAISHHVAREAAALLGIPAARIHVAPPVADPCFRPLPAEECERRLAPLRERLGLRDGFLLTVSHLHHAKNLRGLFGAYARLSPEARRELPLVLACELHPTQAATVRAWARERRIEADLVLTGFVSDEELVALYNAATMYVHASLSEGFGLPVLEALRCGAAVVAADASSLPEVVGEAGLLADPADPAALARAIEDLRRDPERRRELGERALEQAARFRDEDLGRETLLAYEEAVRASRERPGKPLRLALWTPVPPQESGISDYSVELVRQLVRHAEVEIFADDGILPGPEIANLAPVHLFTAFEWRDRRRPYDAVLYQLGASYFHLYMDETLRHRPGIVTLHDLTWGALLYREAALWGKEEAFRRTLVASEGEEAAAEYAALGNEDPSTLAARIEDFLNRYLLLGGVVAASQAQIVHLPGAASALEAQYPGARVFEFPMGVEDPRRSLPEGENDLRQRLGIAQTAFLIGAFGVADPVKRLEEGVRALERLAADLPEADPVLLIVGGFNDPAYRERLEALAVELGIGGRIRVLGRTAKRDFDLALLACDAVVNLRYPFRHQMSATLMRAIAAGRPVVISDVPSWNHFPDSFCLRVAPDEREVETLAGHLTGLARDPERRQAMGEAARRFWEENATPAHMAHNYLRILAEVTGRPIEEWERTEELDTMSESAPSGSRLPSSETFAETGPSAEAETTEALSTGGGAAEPPPAPQPPDSAPVTPRDDSALVRLETAYRSWDAVRSRSAPEEASGGGIRGGLGSASRMAARVRDLGISWDLQRDLFRVLLDQQAEIHRRLDVLENREALTEMLTARLAAAEAEISRLRTLEDEIHRLRAGEADVRGAIHEMRAVEADLRAAIDEMLAEMRTGGWNPGEMANLRDRQESLRVRQARLEGDLADLRQQRAGMPGALPLSPRDFAEILASLEKDAPAGERPNAVEVSLQDVRAEDLLLAARRHFGGRLSSSGPEYRSPNDLWIHVDFSAWWNRPLLLENAAARLAPGGRFVLVTATAAGEPPRHLGLRIEEDRAVSLASGGDVRVVIYSTLT